jgi:hypothetical protein
LKSAPADSCRSLRLRLFCAFAAFAIVRDASSTPSSVIRARFAAIRAARSASYSFFGAVVMIRFDFDFVRFDRAAQTEVVKDALLYNNNDAHR